MNFVVELMRPLLLPQAACQLLAAPLVASVVDGWGLVPLIVGLLVECLSTALFGVTSGYEVWFGARAIQGLASSLVLSTGPSLHPLGRPTHPSAGGGFLHVQQLYAGDNAGLGNAMGIATTGPLPCAMGWVSRLHGRHHHGGDRGAPSGRATLRGDPIS